MRSRPSSVVLAVWGCVLPIGACSDSPFGGATSTIGADMVTADTTLLVGEVAAFEAFAIYGIGPGLPTSIVWTSSDTGVATVTRLSDGRGSVAARAAGTARISALVNNAFSDSAQLTVVQTGDIRWRVATSPGPSLYAAVGLDSLVRVVTSDGVLSTFGRDGGGGVPLTSCDGLFGPSVDGAGSAYATGTACTRRHSSTGGTIWSSTQGDVGGGVAIGADEAALIVHSLPDTGGTTGAVVVSRISTGGVEAWRDTLRPLPLEQRSAPAIAANGDVYVGWRAPADSSWVSRITAGGAIRWTMPIPNWPRQTTPAPEPTRVTVTYLGGITVFDTAASVVWSRQFFQANPQAASDVAASSPVIAAAGTIYVQTTSALYAYDPAGGSLWVADSLGAGGLAETVGAGAPALLGDGTVVVVVGASRVCGVAPTTGATRWCSPSLGADVIGGVAVGPDRTIYVSRSSGELIALWNRVDASTVGWPTEGGNHRRTRRRP
jgi:hypothetical protein